VSKVMTFLAFVVAVVGTILYFTTDLSLAQLLAFGAGALFLLWQVVLLTVPWSLYYQVPEKREAEAAALARRLWWAAIAAHVVSAGVVAVITLVSGEEIGYYFSGFYLLSTAFRPAQAYFAYLRRHLLGMLNDVKYPHENIAEVRDRLAAAEAEIAALKLQQEEQRETDAELRRLIEAVEVSTTARDNRLDTQLDAMGRKFEDTVNRLTDNQEVIAGIKAFLRLIRTDQV
jgi:septal ring factor EnvC (AmiA/AmiB activator)